MVSIWPYMEWYSTSSLVIIASSVVMVLSDSTHWSCASGASFSWMRPWSGNIHQHDLTLFFSGNPQQRLALHRDAVTGIGGNTVDLDPAAGRYQIDLAPRGNSIVRSLPRFQGGGDQAGICPDGQGITILRQPTGQGDKGSAAFTLGERSGTPGRGQPFFVGQDPYLEQPRFLVLQVELAMGDASAGTHYLYIAREGPALVAQTVLVGDRSLADIGDDLHVAVRMGWEPRMRSDDVIVPYAQMSPVHAFGIMVFSKGKMVPGIQPTVVGTT